jgi:hypothetical protein
VHSGFCCCPYQADIINIATVARRTWGPCPSCFWCAQCSTAQCQQKRRVLACAGRGPDWTNPQLLPAAASGLKHSAAARQAPGLMQYLHAQTHTANPVRYPVFGHNDCCALYSHHVSSFQTQLYEAHAFETQGCWIVPVLSDDTPEQHGYTMAPAPGLIMGSSRVSTSRSSSASWVACGLLLLLLMGCT